MTQGTDEKAEAWFHRKATDYVETQILYHLNQVGVWQLLAQGHHHAHDIAASLGLVPEVLKVLLEYVDGVDTLLVRDEEGRFGLSDFGQRVLSRFGRTGRDGTTYNLFDVRVGAYGPVWSQLGGMLRGEARYGREIERSGERAAEAVFTVGQRMKEGFLALLERHEPTMVVELGVTSGLLELASRRFPAMAAVGIDRNDAALRQASRRFMGETGKEGQWIEGDIFAVDSWIPGSFARERGLFVSVHFHEFLARGVGELQRWVAALRAKLPGWLVLAIEQPRLRREDRQTVSEVGWLYNHSNVLIHHLIGNGHILSDASWRQLFEEVGCELVEIHPMEFLGYKGYTFRL